MFTIKHTKHLSKDFFREGVGTVSAQPFES